MQIRRSTAEIMNDSSTHYCKISWVGETKDYENFSRVHQVRFPRGQSVASANIAQSKSSDAMPTNPEELLAASVGCCMMLTFLAVASKAQLVVTEYQDEPEALVEFVDRRNRVTRVTLKPEVRFAGTVPDEQFQLLFSKAHANCLITLSVKSEVIVLPTNLSA